MKVLARPIVNFGGWPCWIKWQQYSNGRIAIQLMCEEGPMAIATVNIPEVSLKDNEVIIKDYSENQGVLAALIKARVIKKTRREVPIGNWSLGFVCKLLVKPE